MTDRAQNLGNRRDAFETMRDTAADAYRVETGSMWRPRRGSHTSQTGKLTSAAIDARDFQRARKDRKTMAHLPQGTLVAIAGGKDIANPAAVIERLDKARAKYSDMILVHGGGPGVEKIAASWAERNGVHQIVCKPDWDRYGRAAPFRRNDDLLNLLPKGVIAFPGSGITENLVDQGAAARHSGSAHRGLSRTRAASLRWRGPFLSRFNRRRTMLPLVRRQPQQPRARFAPRSPPRFRSACSGFARASARLAVRRCAHRLCTVLRTSASATAPTSAHCRSRCSRHSCRPS